jgi:hypothetical protein
VVAGTVVEETGEAVLVQSDPYGRAQPVRVLLKDVAQRTRSELSTMPPGLLSTFQQEDILDLLAYLESLRTAAKVGE